MASAEIDWRVNCDPCDVGRPELDLPGVESGPSVMPGVGFSRIVAV